MKIIFKDIKIIKLVAIGNNIHQQTSTVYEYKLLWINTITIIVFINKLQLLFTKKLNFKHTSLSVNVFIILINSRHFQWMQIFNTTTKNHEYIVLFN